MPNMSDPMSWSIPAGRYFGIRVRIHILFLLLLLFETWKAAAVGGLPGLKLALIWEAILFFSVLLHEFGHCFAARAVGGSAEQILMWPLGGLAYVEAPNTPRAQFITTVWGPLVNVGIALVCAAIILAGGFLPPLNPFHPFELWPLPGATLAELDVPSWLLWPTVTFGLNCWILLLFNVIPAFPMDGGRLLRCVLWRPLGFARATIIAVVAAKLCAVLMGCVGLYSQQLLLVGIAIFVYVNAERERQMLEAGMLFDESVFGYDFSQGYTSLAASAPRPRPRRLGFLQRWWRRRQELKRRREAEQQEQQDRQVDEILAKLHREGMASLTEQERRFLTRVSAKYRERNQSGG